MRIEDVDVPGVKVGRIEQVLAAIVANGHALVDRAIDVRGNECGRGWRYRGVPPRNRSVLGNKNECGRTTVADHKIGGAVEHNPRRPIALSRARAAALDCLLHVRKSNDRE